MNILDLIEQYDTERSERFVKSARVNMDMREPTAKPLGKGTNAKVYDHPKDPHMVNRVTKAYNNASHEKSYDTFIEAMLDDPDAKTNIHFPRVYGVRKFKSREGKVRARYETERLVPMQSVELEVLKAAIDSVYELDYEKYPVENVSKLGVTFAMQMQTAITYDAYDSITSDELVRALKFVKKVRETIAPNSYGGFDLHDENIMLRLTPTGPQIVFSDPL